MKVTAKLTVTLMVVIVAVVSMQAFRSLDRITAMHLNETRDSLYIRASAVGAAIDAVFRAEGRARAMQYAAQENERYPGVAIRVIDVDPAVPALSADGFAGLVGASRRDVIATTDDALTARVAVGAGGDRAVVEFAQPLAPHRSFMREVFWEQVAFTVLLSLLCAGVLLALGFVLIGRPMKLLVEQARTVANGDFSRRADVRQRDEVGSLAAEMNRMSEQLAESHQQVQNERRARTAALEQLRHSDRLSTVGKIASGIAHELGTPLNVVSGRAMLIAQTSRCPDDIAANARIIVEQTEDIARIIRELLDFARRRVVKRESVQLRELLEHARDLLEPLAEEQDIAIEIATRCDDEAEVDELKLLQVITNLVINGIQAMPHGGLLELGWRPESVREPPEGHAAPGEYVCITVKDSGMGIEPDRLDRIFEPFVTTKSEGKGTGLGLSVCHGIVKEHGGWIGVESEPGRGSTFSVHVPRGASAS